MFARRSLLVTLSLAAQSIAALSLGTALAGCSNSNTNGNNGYYPNTNGGGFDTSVTADANGGGGGGGGGGGTDASGGGTDEDASTVNPGTDTSTGPVANFTGYAAPEMNLRIIGPSGRGHAVVSGSIVEVAGVLFGNADEITWSTDTGGSGSAHGSPFFQTDPITLVVGDNVITVTAKGAQGTVSDTLVVTYNPVFQFQDRLRANPRVIKSGKSTSVNAVIAIGKGTNVVKGSVKLTRVDAANNVLTTFGAMSDDGDLSGAGDEIKGDGLYSRKITINDGNPGDVRLRATVQVQAGGQTVTAYSDVVTLDVVQDVPGSECTEVVQALADAKTAGDQAAIVAALQANPAVAEAGPVEGSGAWVRFKSGLLGAVTLRKDGNRGGEGDSGEPVVAQAGNDANLGINTIQVQSKRALLLDPFAADFGADEIASAQQMFSKLQCPAYTVDTASGNKADLHWFRQLYNYGIFAIASHGDAYFREMPAASQSLYDWKHQGTQEILWTGHQVDCKYFGNSGAPQKSCSEKQGCGPEAECFLNASGGNGVCVDHLTADLRRGRVVIGSDGTYGVTGGFIKRHAEEPYPRSLVYLGACRSLWNGTIAGEMFAAGAAAVLGYTGFVRNDFATQWGTTFLSNVVEQKKLSGVAHVQIGDEANPGTQFRLIGANNLDAFFSDMINPSWETGSVQGWIKAGDGRVISRLGSTVPVAGKFMGIISTGLGYTSQTGEINQRFCIPEGKTKFSFWWKYYSEEFKEFCGSQFQDAFLAKLEGTVNGKPGAITVVNAKVDDLCDGGSQFKGLTQADVAFDQGDVWMTPWVQSTKDISPFAGNGSVLLRYFATDTGDSIYDTVVLIDKAEFN